MSPPPLGVAIVGGGLRGVWNLGRLLAEGFPELGLEVVALCEPFAPRAAEAKRFLEERYAKAGRPLEIALHADVESCARDPRVRLVMVTTPSHVHRGPVERALAAGRRVYVDKPLAHDLADCDAILDAERRSGGPLLVGFTRRFESAWRRARALVAEGAIGDVHMLLLRAVLPYHVYFHGWHRERRFSGDALNDKSSHHLDAMAWFAGADPERVSGFGGRRVFLPEEGAPERCSACDRTCPYRIGPEPSRRPDVLRADTARAWLGGDDVLTQRDRCVFQPGADILDHAVVNVRFANGAVGQLFYGLFGFDSDDQETFEVVGTRGRLRLVRHSGRLELLTEHGAREETLDARDANHASVHFGADEVLVRALRRFAEGGAPPVGARDGHRASAAVFAALASIEADGAPQRVSLR